MTTCEVLTGGHGRDLGRTSYGPRDGRVVLVHHGLFGSAELGEAWTRRAEAHGVRLVAVERPGYGVSAPLEVAAQLNARPRKRLGWRSPDEAAAHLSC